VIVALPTAPDSVGGSVVHEVVRIIAVPGAIPMMGWAG